VTRILKSMSRNSRLLALRVRIDALALGDRTVARDVTCTLINTNRATLRHMTEARAAGAWHDLGRAAHRLAGPLSMLQRRRESRLALCVERAAMQGDVLSVTAMFPQLVDTIEKLNEQLDALLK